MMPFKDFTTPRAARLFAPDAECLVIASRNDSPIGERLEADDCSRVPLKDFTGPRAVGLSAPDTERIVPTPRPRLYHRGGHGGT